MRMVSRLVFALGLFLALAGLLPAGALAQAKPVTITFWDAEPADLVKLRMEILKGFEAKYPHIKINYLNIPYAEARQKLVTAAATKTLPDTMFFQATWLGEFAAMGELLDLGPYAEKWPGGKNLLPQVFSVGKAYKNTLYYLPSEFQIDALFYRTDWFKEAGIKGPPTNWAEFLDAAKKLTDPAKKKFGYQANGNWYRDIGWIVLTGKREFDNIIDPKKSQFGNPDVVKMLQTVAYDLPHVDKAAPNPTDTSGANTINTGACAMKYEGAWFLPQLNTPQLREQKKEIVFDVVRMPKGAGAGRPHRGWGEGLCLGKTNKTEASWRFASYLVGEEGNKLYCELTGRIPSNLALAQSWWLPRAKELYGIENAKAFLDAFKEGQIDVVSGVPRSKMWAEVVKPTGWDVINAGTAKPTEVLPKVDEKLQKLLDDYWKTQ